MSLSNSIPKSRIHRQTVTKTLGCIFECNDDNIPIYFDSKLDDRSNSDKLYRIPDHQRYPQWNSDKINKLIDTIFRNYPISNFTMTQKTDPNTMRSYYDIEDGQTRLSILQDFYMNRISYQTDTDMITFDDLPRSSKRAFENYTIIIDVISGKQEFSDEDLVDDISEIFERLQNGEKLKDCDLYWNRRHYPIIAYARELITKAYWQSDYMDTKRGITDKYRVNIPKVVSLIYVIKYFNLNRELKPEISGRKTFSVSWRQQILEKDPSESENRLQRQLTDEDKLRVKNFLHYYNYIITRVYEEYPKDTFKPREKVNVWCNNAKQLGMILYEYLLNEEASVEDKRKLQEKWIKIIMIDRVSPNFMYSGCKTMWNLLKNNEARNVYDKCLETRLHRINEFYSDPIKTSEKYGIEFTSEDSHF